MIIEDIDPSFLEMAGVEMEQKVDRFSITDILKKTTTSKQTNKQTVKPPTPLKKRFILYGPRKIKHVESFFTDWGVAEIGLVAERILFRSHFGSSFDSRSPHMHWFTLWTIAIACALPPPWEKNSPRQI